MNREIKLGHIEKLNNGRYGIVGIQHYYTCGDEILLEVKPYYSSTVEHDTKDYYTTIFDMKIYLKDLKKVYYE